MHKLLWDWKATNNIVEQEFMYQIVEQEKGMSIICSLGTKFLEFMHIYTKLIVEGKKKTIWSNIGAKIFIT